MDKDRTELYKIPKGLTGLFKKNGTAEFIASLILGKAIVMCKSEDSCVMSDAFIRDVLPGCISRAQIQRALNVLKKYNLVSLGRCGDKQYGARVVFPNFEKLDGISDPKRGQERSQNDTTPRSQNSTLAILKEDASDPKTIHQRSYNEIDMILKEDGNDPETSYNNKTTNKKILKIYIERFFQNFFYDNLQSLIADDDFFKCDIEEAKKSIPRDGGEFDDFLKWFDTNLKTWANLLLSFKFSYNDEVTDTLFADSYAFLSHVFKFHDDSKSHVIDYLCKTLRNECKGILKVNKAEVLEQYGEFLFDRLMFKKWRLQIDEGIKATMYWTEIHVMALGCRAYDSLKWLRNDRYKFTGFDVIARKHYKSKDLIRAIMLWNYKFFVYKFPYSSNYQEFFEGLLPDTQSDEFMQYVAGQWDANMQICRQLKLPTITMEEAFNFDEFEQAGE